MRTLARTGLGLQPGQAAPAPLSSRRALALAALAAACHSEASPPSSLEPGAMGGATGGDTTVAVSGASGTFGVSGASGVSGAFQGPPSGGNAGAPPGAGGQGGTGGGLPVASGGAPDPRGHEGPLFDDLRLSERHERFYFAEAEGRVVIEAEHFTEQRYGDLTYQGARWWMVNSAKRHVKDLPEFVARCQTAQEELQKLDEKPAGSERTVRSIITNHSDSLTSGWEAVFQEFACDPDGNREGSASGAAYIELLPDALYDNHNSVPHAGCNWYNPVQGPRVYYRVHFGQAGAYELWFRALNSDTDSGDMFVGVAESPEVGEQYSLRIGPARTSVWEWVQAGSFNVKAGEFWLVLAGREDGFEVDKLVMTRTGCAECTGLGPVESLRHQ